MSAQERDLQRAMKILSTAGYICTCTSTRSGVWSRMTKCRVTYNEKAIAARKKFHDYFALVSNYEKDALDCLDVLSTD